MKYICLSETSILVTAQSLQRSMSNFDFCFGFNSADVQMPQDRISMKNDYPVEPNYLFFPRCYSRTTKNSKLLFVHVSCCTNKDVLPCPALSCKFVVHLILPAPLWSAKR